MLTVDYDLLDVRPGHAFLDAGCGAGRHSFEAYRRGARVFAMDYDLAECKKVLYSLATACDADRQKGGSWNLVHGDVICLPFAEESFDRIICAEVCEHLHEDMRVLRDMTRILKRGGRIAVTVPTTFSEAIYGLIEPFYFENPGGHVRIFTPWELVKKMRRAGLKIYGVRHAHGFHTPYWLLRCIFGLTNEDHPVSKAYRKFLEMQIMSPLMTRVEKKIFDRVCPKSIIIYGWKP
jgi:ubiquinone/menaquinone biosynthesis C-methylase UbiE